MWSMVHMGLRSGNAYLRVQAREGSGQGYSCFEMKGTSARAYSALMWE